MRSPSVQRERARRQSCCHGFRRRAVAWSLPPPLSRAGAEGSSRGSDIVRCDVCAHHSLHRSLCCHQLGLPACGRAAFLFPAHPCPDSACCFAAFFVHDGGGGGDTASNCCGGDTPPTLRLQVRRWQLVVGARVSFARIVWCRRKATIRRFSDIVRVDLCACHRLGMPASLDYSVPVRVLTAFIIVVDGGGGGRRRQRTRVLLAVTAP
jgi:hypothetical protein